MASHMKRTRIRRAMKKSARGRKRKAKIQARGSTPPRLPMKPSN